MAKIEKSQAPATAPDPYANVIKSSGAEGNGASSADIAQSQPEAPPVAVKPANELSPFPAVITESGDTSTLVQNGVVVPSAGAGRYRVSFNPPTPVAHNVIECDADNEQGAWEQLMKANGIRGSSTPRAVVRLGDKSGAAVVLIPEPKPPFKPVIDGVPLKPAMQPA